MIDQIIADLSNIEIKSVNDYYVVFRSSFKIATFAFEQDAINFAELKRNEIELYIKRIKSLDEHTFNFVVTYRDKPVGYFIERDAAKFYLEAIKRAVKEKLDVGESIQVQGLRSGSNSDQS